MGKRILIAVEDADSFQPFACFLTKRGHEITTVKSTGAALCAVMTEKPDILIAGLDLTLYGGEYLVKTVKRDHFEISVIGVSTWEENKVFCEEIGIPYLAMPFSPSKLIEMIETI